MSIQKRIAIGCTVCIISVLILAIVYFVSFGIGSLIPRDRYNDFDHDTLQWVVKPIIGLLILLWCAGTMISCIIATIVCSGVCNFMYFLHAKSYAQ